MKLVGLILQSLNGKLSNYTTFEGVIGEVLNNYYSADLSAEVKTYLLQIEAKLFKVF